MFCLDTNIIIFALKSGNKPYLLDKIRAELSLGNISTTSITVLELLYYSFKHEASSSLILRQKFLDLLTTFDFDSKAALIASQTKSKLENQGKTIDILDLQIASICLANNLTLVTNNTKHFERIEGLKFEDWTD